MKTILNVFLVLLVISLSSGCASLSILSSLVTQYPILALDAVTLTTTGKSTTENVVSDFTGKDCKLTNIFRGDSICTKNIEINRE